MKKITFIAGTLFSLLTLSRFSYAQVPVNANVGVMAEYAPVAFGAYYPASAPAPVPADAKGFFVVRITKSGADIPANNYSVSLSLPAGAAWTGEAFTLPAGYTLDATLSSNTSLYILQTGAHTGSGIAAMKTINIPVQATAPENPTTDNYMAQIVREGIGYTDNDPINDASSAMVFVGGVNLPVNMRNFTAARAQSASKLEWNTFSENNNKGFAIERSSDARSWQEIGFVASEAADGNSTSLIGYSFFDIVPEHGINHYRLRQTAKDRQYSYSNVQSVVFETTGQISLSPNPASDLVQVKGLAGTENILVYNALGQLVRAIKVSGNTTAEVKLGDLSPGVYIFSVITPDGTKTQYRISKQK